MADSGRQPRLTVINGAKAAPGHAGEPTDAPPPRVSTERVRLHALGPVRSTPKQQLTLPWIAPAKRTIVSLGLKGIAKAELADVIRRHDIRRVADIRISPSFRGPDFDLADITHLFQLSGISYRRFSLLANRFIGESINPHAVLDMYERYIATQENALRELDKAVDAGPLLLLGWSEHHSPSERAILVDALARLGKSFELVLASVDRNRP